MAGKSKQPFRLFPLLREVLAPEAGFAYAAIVYSIAISIMTLAVPLSVQVLIEAVANTALPRSVFVLSLALFGVLTLSGMLIALQAWAMEIFERRFFARITAEISLRILYADHESLEKVNRDDLLNRYFEIMNVQKTLPAIVVGGSTLLLQTLVGYVVVSFYHPVFFAFSLAHALLVYLVWRIVDRPATDSAIDISSAKLAMADWLETIARNNHFFKSRRTMDYALRRTQGIADRYVKEHRRHFRYAYFQVLGLLALYAVASAALLGAGGWLVIIGELSLGQLVAAELILGAIFAGLAGFHYYLELYYDLCAGLSKLAHFFQVPLEEAPHGRELTEQAPTIRFHDVRINYRGREFELDGEFPGGSCTLVAARSGGTVKLFRDVLSRFREPEKGYVLIGECDLKDFNAHDLRDAVLVLGDSMVFDGTIAEFLALADPSLSRASMRRALEMVDLSEAVDTFEDGVNKRISPYGYPLAPTETMRLKAAQALLMKPKVLVVTPLFDALQCHHRRAIVEQARALNITLIFMSNRRDLDAFDRYQLLDIEVEEGAPTVFGKLDELVAFETARDLRVEGLVEAPAGLGGSS
jgi:ABC-type bacteriocin/lantibiotic exporter with double-glycine peptidase domain